MEEMTLQELLCTLPQPPHTVPPDDTTDFLADSAPILDSIK